MQSHEVRKWIWTTCVCGFNKAVVPTSILYECLDVFINTHTAKAQMFLCPQKGRRTVAKARPWVNISVTWEGK